MKRIWIHAVWNFQEFSPEFSNFRTKVLPPFWHLPTWFSWSEIIIWSSDFASWKKRMLFKLGEKLTQPLFKENKTQKCMKTLRKFQTRQASPNYLCIVITLSGVSRVYSTQCIICVHGESTDSHFSLEGNCHCHVYRDWLCLKIATR